MYLLKMNELSKNVEAISPKGLTKDLINGCKILKGTRHFFSETLQNHLVYFSFKKHIRFFTHLKFDHGNI